METSNSGWKECKLGKVCSFQEGYVNPPQGYPEYFDGNIKWLRATDLNNGYVYNTSRTLTEKGFRSAGKSAILFKPNTIGISKSGTIGRLGILKDYMCGNRAVINIMPSGDVDTQFIYYALFNRRNEFEQLAVGSVQKNLYVPILAELDIKLPPLNTQRRIAAVLSALDDKVELNNRINANLEAQTQALFRSWFVDFEPWGGRMPDGWTEENIYSVATIVYGVPFASKYFNEDKRGLPIVRIRDLKEQSTTTYTTEIHPLGCKIQAGDIVVGMDGEFRPYIWGTEAAWVNQRVCLFKPKQTHYRAFVYQTIRPLLLEVERTEVATTVIHIGKRDFDAFRIILPTEDVLMEFGRICEPFYEKIVANMQQSHVLAALRDTLLPKLMSGEIDVSRVEVPA